LNPPNSLPFLSRLTNPKDLDLSYQPEDHEKPELPKGCIVIKMVRCGKEGCSSCPHGPYAYLVTKKDGKQTWKYLGLAKDLPRLVRKEATE